MGEKYVPPMAAVMADDTPGETKACLDLGCGSGSWYIHRSFPRFRRWHFDRITDVARDFPNCTAVGIDLIPMQATWVVLLSLLSSSIYLSIGPCLQIFGEICMSLFICLGFLNIFGLLRSEVDDINLGIEHFYGDFNVVNARLISSGVSV